MLSLSNMLNHKRPAKLDITNLLNNYEDDISSLSSSPTSVSSLFSNYPFPQPHTTDSEEEERRVKAKRKRANSEQLEVLNRVFDRTFFPSTQVRAELGRQLGMSPRTVQIWFQNRRQAMRTKERQRLIKIRNDTKSKSILSHSTLTKDQSKYCSAILKTLKKHRDAGPFLDPVDPIRLNIPDYFQVIKQPMDLSTVDQKLQKNQYKSVNAFVADVRLIFQNCMQYNGTDSTIAVLCRNLKAAFEKCLRGMPPAAEEKRIEHDPIFDDFDVYDSSQQKETHSMRSCFQILNHLKAQKHLSFPFLYPVDPVALNIPDYPSIVKHPIDLSTIETKLNQNAYDSPHAFAADIKLMFNNCYLYNAPELPIYDVAKELEAIFDRQWEIKAKQPASVPRQIKPSKRPAVERKMKSRKKKKRESLSYEEKKELSERINRLTGDRLNEVIQIIQSSLPDLDKGETEIVLDIDALDINTLKRLNDFVHNKANTVHSDEGKTLANYNKSTSNSSSHSSSFDDLD
ncbi:hypothetical protein G6F46_009442 [Rhizopus delemar]|uniref:Transcription factor n=2 Tax=Rhizopus TaxID=4842 RepID=A0A9P6Z1T0_9FUNG|nr:hypothetical protein G6F55_011440 [Rhizopus delemar]KAG1539844.1 hypothetical protein G6F51_008892 [Rhizopus arrhizus]KAG1492521.1 hypothetical protein G6F54_009253 [Rhizopus delemar]KAG1508268.1 hypothetical protein G6F53_008322 [Rhizopus delemar]KAG1510700.1 hypothetical protein G6F52_010836 [Rhizopus delemar]